MSTTRHDTLWSQELQVHWPKSWRFLTGRDILLETFAPRIFSVEEDAVFIRFAEHQDLRVSQYGLHIRILTSSAVDEKAKEILDQVTHIIEPTELSNISATFSHVHALKADYDEARRDTARLFYQPWISRRPIKDYALYWDEEVSTHAEGNFSVGIVNDRELIGRIAQASGTAEDVLRRRIPAWMKVRMPRVAVFMQSKYSSDEAVSAEIGEMRVPQYWRQWRERSDSLFDQLTDMTIPAERGELS
jgi:hypothetical protein